MGTCGTCAVEIYSTEGTDENEIGNGKGSSSAIEPAERNTKEKLRLNFPPHGSSDQSSNLRLACQVQVMGDITVKKRTGFWGQDAPSGGGMNADNGKGSNINSPNDDGSLAEEYEPQLWFGDLEYILDDKSPPQQNDLKGDV